MGFLNQNFASFFLKFHELLFRSKDEEEERKEGRKETERIYVCVCLPYVLCIVFLLNRTACGGTHIISRLSLAAVSKPPFFRARRRRPSRRAPLGRASTSRPCSRSRVTLLLFLCIRSDSTLSRIPCVGLSLSARSKSPRSRRSFRECLPLALLRGRPSRGRPTLRWIFAVGRTLRRCWSLSDGRIGRSGSA